MPSHFMPLCVLVRGSIALSLVGALPLVDRSASAQIIPLTQSRNVVGDSNALGPAGQQQDIEEIIAPDFNPFVESLETTATNGVATAAVETTQTSSITACRLEAAAGYVSNAAVTEANHIGYGVGITDYRVTFQLQRPTPYRIFARLDAGEFSHVRLVLLQSNVGLVNVLAANQVIDIAQQGTLGAGQYTFSLNASGTASASEVGTNHNAAAFDGFFTVCFTPADLNGDNFVDVSDLLQLIGVWGPCNNPATCLADLDASGTVNVADLLALIGSWK